MPMLRAGTLNIAASNASVFSNAKINDLLIKTTYDDQTVLIGPNSLVGGPSTLSVATNKISLVGDIYMSGNIISTNGTTTTSLANISASNVTSKSKSSFGGLKITKNP